jgi:hypothetical protein
MEPRTMIAPPRLASWLLEVAIPTCDGQAIAGDLAEEFHDRMVPHRGRWFAHWWFCWQVARSLAPLFIRSWERASVVRASSAIVSGGLAATLPAAALLMLRTFVLQQVPLKTTAEPSAVFVAMWLIVVLVTAGFAAAFAVRILNPKTNR